MNPLCAYFGYTFLSYCFYQSSVDLSTSKTQSSDPQALYSQKIESQRIPPPSVSRVKNLRQHLSAPQVLNSLIRYELPKTNAPRPGKYLDFSTNPYVLNSIVRNELPEFTSKNQDLKPASSIAKGISTLNTISRTPNFLLEYQWQFINFTWPSYEVYTNALLTRRYIPENIAIAGIKYYKGDLYLAIPQIRNGVPVTLGVITTQKSRKFNPLISPYPSWRMHSNPNDCATLQSVQSMEIDRNGIMWILDGHRLNPRIKCPPKLILLDLNNGGKLISVRIFPNEIALAQGGLLDDIVLDDSDGGYAYVTDNSLIDPGLIVYSVKKNRVWKLRDRTMFGEKDAADFVVSNMTFTQLSPINGIALSPTNPNNRSRVLFFSSLTGVKLYSVRTCLLKNETLLMQGDWRRGVKMIGRKQAQGDGMIMDHEGNLYYSLLPLDGVGKWNMKLNLNTAQVVEQNAGMMWPDSFCFDDAGYLRVISNNINRFVDVNNVLRLSGEVYFKVFKYFTGTKSYIYS